MLRPAYNSRMRVLWQQLLPVTLVAGVSGYLSTALAFGVHRPLSILNTQSRVGVNNKFPMQSPSKILTATTGTVSPSSSSSSSLDGDSADNHGSSCTTASCFFLLGISKIQNKNNEHKAHGQGKWFCGNRDLEGSKTKPLSCLPSALTFRRTSHRLLQKFVEQRLMSAKVMFP
jgi:hypothetical protein